MLNAIFMSFLVWEASFFTLKGMLSDFGFCVNCCFCLKQRDLDLTKV